MQPEYLVTAFHGIIVFQFFFVLIFYFSNHRKEYLYYCLYLLAVAAYFIYQFSYRTPEGAVSPGATVYNELHQWFPILVYILYALFIIHLLDTRRTFPRIHFISKSLIVLFSIYLVIDAGFIFVSGNPLNPLIYWLSSIAFIPLPVIMGIDIYKKRNRVNSFVLAGSLIAAFASFISTVMIVLEKFYGQQPMAHPVLISYLGVICETLCFSAAMLYNSIRIEKQKTETERALRLREEQNRQLQAGMEEMRTKISADLHDQIGSTLYSVSLFSQMAARYMENREHEGQVIGILDRISESSNRMLTEMNDIVWVINPVNDGFDKVLDRFRKVADDLLLPLGIACHFSISFDRQVESMSMQVRKNLYLVFREAVTNASRYAKCREVHVHGVSTAEGIEISIHDDGVGFTPESVTNGNGLWNMERRMKESGGRCEIISAEGRGTGIRLFIPLPKIG